jgi:hypothetical protein
MKRIYPHLHYASFGLIGLVLLAWAILQFATITTTEACTTTPNCTTWDVNDSGCSGLTCNCLGNPIQYTCYYEEGYCSGNPNTNFILFRRCYLGSCTCPSGTGGGGGEGDPQCEPACEDPYVCLEGGICGYSPIVVDVLGNGIELTNAAGGVNFYLNDKGLLRKVAWTTANSDDAWLALDRNGNGRIDNGTELFGNITPQPAGRARNGFLALAEYDRPANGGNGDGAIDNNDSIFASLRLWQDSNHNGISEASELHSLRDPGLERISLTYKESRRTDRNGNRFTYRSKVEDALPSQVGRWAWDVFLMTDR